MAMRNLTDDNLNPALPRLAALLLGLAALFLSGVPAWGDEERRHAKVGEVVLLGPAVEVVHAFNGGDNRAQIGSSLYVNDVVKTGKNSPVEYRSA